jgi:hypothetical protein
MFTNAYFITSIQLLYFPPKNSLVLANDKHTHNMMQPPLCLNIVVLSDMLCLICPKQNALYSGQSLLLKCHVANRVHVLEYIFFSVQAFFFSLCHLG